MSKIHQIDLQADQFISDIAFPQTQGKRILLQAGTGVGKTTFIMDGGIKEYLFIIQIIPSVLKVRELEQQYSKQANDIGYLFYYDKKTPNELASSTKSN